MNWGSDTGENVLKHSTRHGWELYDNKAIRFMLNYLIKAPDFYSLNKISRMPNCYHNDQSSQSFPAQVFGFKSWILRNFSVYDVQDGMSRES